MFLSKVTLQSSTHSAIELSKLGANGPYASHQLLWKLFTNEDERNFLFREEFGQSGLPLFFVLSKSQPQNDHTLFSVQTKRFEPKLFIGQRLTYKLRVNPTVCLTDDAGKSKRHDVLMHAKYHLAKDERQNKQNLKTIMDAAAQAWISDPKRLQKWGVQLDMLPEIESYSQHQSQKKLGNPIRFSSVDFAGILTIKEPNIFIGQLSNGFGRAKSLGCGLMLVKST
jgi:CRISPR system Cascade subunit CasE